MKALHRVPKKGLKTTGMLGKQVSDFSLASTGGMQFKLAAHRGTELVCTSIPRTVFKQEVRGIERSTLVIGPDGVLAREWRGVKVPSHAQEVLNFAKAL